MSHTLFAAETDTEADAMKQYTWDQFRLTYPAQGWQLKERDSDEHTMNLQLVSERERDLAIVMTLKNNMPPRDANYEENPAMASSAFGLPIALELADKEEERIAVSFAPMNFDEHWELAAHFLVADAEGNGFKLIEAFHYFPESDENYALLGAIMSSGQKGELVEETAHYDYLYQAYEIVQSVQVVK
jgi:hypothetical protein